MATTGYAASAQRDEVWLEEARRETARAVLVTEERAFLANLLGFVGFAVAIMFLPLPSMFAVPLAMRFCALLGTHLTYNHIRRNLDEAPALVPHMRTLSVMLFFGGVSWAYLLLPLLLADAMGTLAFLIGSAILVCVALVITMTAPLREQTAFFLGGFLLAAFAGVVLRS